MKISHIGSGEAVNLRTLKSQLPADTTVALVKTPHMEVIRMVLPAGKKIPPHHVPGEISVQSLSGKTVFFVGEQRNELTEGDWLYLRGGEAHALEAVTDSVLLVTILLHGVA